MNDKDNLDDTFDDLENELNQNKDVEDIFDEVMTKNDAILHGKTKKISEKDFEELPEEIPVFTSTRDRVKPKDSNPKWFLRGFFLIFAAFSIIVVIVYVLFSLSLGDTGTKPSGRASTLTSAPEETSNTPSEETPEIKESDDTDAYIIENIKKNQVPVTKDNKPPAVTQKEVPVVKEEKTETLPTVTKKETPVKREQKTEPVVEKPVNVIPQPLNMPSSEGVIEIPGDKTAKGNIYTDGAYYTIQLSSWKDQATAEREVGRLIKLGHKTFIVKAFVAKFNTTYYRVRVGYFKSLTDAETYYANNKF